MARRSIPSDFVPPNSTGDAVLLPTSRQPSFVRNSTKFLRVAYSPRRGTLVTERFDSNDAPLVYNINEAAVVPTSTGSMLFRPVPTPSTFIAHHSQCPSTWLDDLSLE